MPEEFCFISLKRKDLLKYLVTPSVIDEETEVQAS